MFNPFLPFHIKMIDAFRKANRRYIVSQTNKQAYDHFEEEKKEPLLFSDYDDLQTAQIHFNALTDQYKYILDLENETHRNKIIEMIGTSSKFRVYANYIADLKDTEKKMNDRYAGRIRNYISRRTNWRIGGDKRIVPRLQITFGELFVLLKHGNQTERFKLSELEKY